MSEPGRPASRSVLPEAVVVVGLGLVAWGLYQMWPPLAPTVTGALLAVAGVRKLTGRGR